MKLFLMLWIHLGFISKVKVTSEDAFSQALNDVSKVLLQTRIEISVSSGVNIDSILAAFRNVPYTITEIKNYDAYRVNESGLLIFDSVSSLKEFNSKVILNYEKAFKFIVFIQDATANKLLTVKDTSILQFQYMLLDENNFMNLMTFVYYTPEKCKQTQLIEVNKFDKTSKKWENEKFQIEKFSNFHGCSLVVYAEFKALFLECTALRDHVLCGGLNGKMMKHLAKSLNFNCIFNLYNAKTKENFYKDLKPDLGLSARIYTNLVDMSSNFSVKRPFVFMDEVIAVPPGEEYNEYEKLLLPFDVYTWVLICLVFLMAFSTIFVLYNVRYFTNETRDLMFGEGVTTPSLNVIQAFFGISHIVLPIGNFARFLAIWFIMYCLIIRTAYQGKMFEFLQKEMLKPQAKSLDDIIDKNLTLYSRDNMRDIFDGNDDLIKRFETVSIDRYVSIVMEEIYDPEFKGAVHISSLNFIYIAQESRGHIWRRLIEDRIAFQMFGLLFQKNHKFFESFDNKLQQLFESGETDRFYRVLAQKSDPKRYAHLYRDGPEVLRMEHLEAGFVICLASLLFAFIVFVFEWVIRIMEFIICKCIFSAFYQTLRVAYSFQIKHEFERKFSTTSSVSADSQSCDQQTVIEKEPNCESPQSSGENYKQ